jgi:hypothetical protein
MAKPKKEEEAEPTSWKDRNVTLPAGLIAMGLSAVISVGGVKIADNAWPTEVEVRLALIENRQQETLQILGFLATHHGVDPALLPAAATPKKKGP